MAMVRAEALDVNDKVVLPGRHGAQERVIKKTIMKGTVTLRLESVDNKTVRFKQLDVGTKVTRVS